MSHDQSLVCSLSGPQLVDRIKQWRFVASRATSRHVEPGRVVATYPRDPQVLNLLEELIAAEAQCCPFMQFDVQEGSDEMTVELRVPDDMSEVLGSMLDLVTD